MSNLYDICIIGAGPSGSYAAYLLAKHGYKVLLIDKNKFPRDKCCGGFLSARAQKFLESWKIDMPVQNTIYSLKLYSHKMESAKTTRQAIVRQRYLREMLSNGQELASRIPKSSANATRPSTRTSRPGEVPRKFLRARVQERLLPRPWGLWWTGRPLEPSDWHCRVIRVVGANGVNRIFGFSAWTSWRSCGNGSGARFIIHVPQLQSNFRKLRLHNHFVWLAGSLLFRSYLLSPMAPPANWPVRGWFARTATQLTSRFPEADEVVSIQDTMTFRFDWHDNAVTCAV